MKKVIILFILLYFAWDNAIPTALQENTSDTPQLANAAYERGDYQTAITLYETLLVNGVRDAAVYFNLGNAYYETGQLGSALLNYRRAQQIAPRDATLNANIARARAERLDLLGGETAWPDRLAAATQSLFTVVELGWLTLIMWSLWFITMSAWIIRRGWREYLRWGIVLTSILLLTGLMLFSSRLYVAHRRPIAVVIDLSAQVMSGPGDEYLPIFQLFTAAEIHILETRGEWARFALPDGQQGWIRRAAIAEI